MNNFDKANLQMIRNELNTLLAEFGAKHNIEMHVGNIKFTDTSFDAKLSATIAGEKSAKEKQIDSALQYMINIHNLKVDGLGGRILVGFKAANHKYPFIYELHGQRFKCSVDQAKAQFSK